MHLPKNEKDLKNMGFVIVPPYKFKEEKKIAKNIWKNYGVKNFYKTEHSWSKILKEVIDNTSPKNILEFGCMVGRNLLYPVKRGIRAIGIDINKPAVDFGKEKYGLDLRVGDESILKSFADNSFDLIFTVSVLDHMPKIDYVCSEFIRCARKYIFCLEISLPVEGKIVKYFDMKKKRVCSAVDATYSWKVDKHIPKDKVVNIIKKPERLSGVKSGPYYWSYLFELSN